MRDGRRHIARNSGSMALSGINGVPETFISHLGRSLGKDQNGSEELTNLAYMSCILYGLESVHEMCMKRYQIQNKLLLRRNGGVHRYAIVCSQSSDCTHDEMNVLLAPDEHHRRER
jgi:hypothetical protein